MEAQWMLIWAQTFVLKWAGNARLHKWRQTNSYFDLQFSLKLGKKRHHYKKKVKSILQLIK